MDPDLAQVHFVLSVVYRALGLPGKSVLSAQRSIELDPNYADGYSTLAISLNFDGSPEKGLIAIQHATRLNPLKPFFYTYAEGQAQYLMGDYNAAARLFENVVANNPQFSASHKFLAATYIALGRQEDAQWAASELLTVAPHFNLASEAANNSFADAATGAIFINNLRKAGLR